MGESRTDLFPSSQKTKIGTEQFVKVTGLVHLQGSSSQVIFYGIPIPPILRKFTGRCDEGWDDESFAKSTISM
jgi:hypothetical protein